MALEKDVAVKLAWQIQDAHRFAVGFYQRLLPATTQSAEAFGFTFYSWDPHLFDRPARTKMNPDRKCSWDLVPMCNPCFTFINQKNKSELNAGDRMLDLLFCLDPELYEDSYEDEADPLTLKKLEPTVELQLYQAYKSSKAICFTDAYDQCEEQDDDWSENEVLKLGKYIESSHQTITLADFLVEPELIIKAFLDKHQTQTNFSKT